MRTSDVAELLGITPTRVKQLDHELRPSRRGRFGYRQYDEDVVRAFATARRARAVTAAARLRGEGRLTLAEAAARLGVAESEVDRLRVAGTLRAAPDGNGGWYFRSWHVDALAGALDAARRRAAVPPVEAP